MDWMDSKMVLDRVSPMVQMMDVRRYSFCGLYSVFRPEVHSMRVLPEAMWSSESPIVGFQSLSKDELRRGNLWIGKRRDEIQLRPWWMWNLISSAKLQKQLKNKVASLNTRGGGPHVGRPRRPQQKGNA